MKELGYERRFREWAAREQVRFDRLTYARAGGNTVAYRLSPPARPRGVIVASHGAGNDALFAFVGLFKALLLRGYEVFTFDLDGHGRLSTTEFSAAEAGTAVIHAAEQSKAGERGLPLHLIGVSLGGSLLAYSLPSLEAASATIIAAPLRIDFTWRSVVRELGFGSLRSLWRERGDYGLTGLVPAFGPFKRSLYPIRMASGGDGGFGYIEELNRALHQLQPERCAAGAEIPVLLCYGERDLTAPPSDGERLNGVLQRSVLRISSAQTHLSMAVAEETISAVLQWIERNNEPRASAPSHRKGRQR
ncbi:hypothetical protein BH23GEM6_BH23GEM6_01250 [soil metagenome]